MLMIRLQRVGRKNDPSFRVVVTDSKNGPQSGKFLEVLGSYNARFGKPQLASDRIKYWLTAGAQLSDTVKNMLIKFKIISGQTVNVLGPKPVKSAVESKAETSALVTETVVEETQVEVPVATTSESDSLTETSTTETTS